MQEGGAKSEFRKILKESLLGLSEQDMISQSVKIKERFNKLADRLLTEGIIKENNLFIYVSTPGEVDTFEIIKQYTKQGSVWVPRCRRDKLEVVRINDINDLESGAYGILEPSIDLKSEEDLNKIYLAVIPGLGFDYRCNRLGRGKGYYDRLFGSSKAQFIKIGFAFDCQVCRQIPTSVWDQKLDFVLTPYSIYSFGTLRDFFLP